MKTGGTIDRLERAASALKLAASGIRHGRIASAEGHLITAATLLGEVTHRSLRINRSVVSYVMATEIIDCDYCVESILSAHPRGKGT